MVAMNLNNPTYALASATSSAAITLTDQDTGKSSVLVINATASPVFLVSGETAAPTAAFPTSATVPVDGVVIPANKEMLWKKNTSHKYISGISLTLDAGKYCYIQVGSGD